MNKEDKVEKLEVKDEVKKEETKPKMRQIVIETDGNNVNLVSAEVSGAIELVAILRNLADFLSNNKK